MNVFTCKHSIVLDFRKQRYYQKSDCPNKVSGKQTKKATLLRFASHTFVLAPTFYRPDTAGKLRIGRGIAGENEKH